MSPCKIQTYSFTAENRGAPQLIKSRFQSNQSQPKMGDRYHLYSDEKRWLVLFVNNFRFTFSHDYWLFLRKKMDTRLVLNTLEDALLKRTYEQGELILHSDLGSHYTSQVYEEALKDVGILHSFSKKGCPYDNAGMESFHASIKKERIIVIRLMGVLNKHKRMFLILFIVFTFGNGSTAPSRISHLLKLKKLHNRSLSAYFSHFFGQKSRVNYFRASINGQAFFNLRVDGNSGILPKWTFLKKLSKKCVSDIDFIPHEFLCPRHTTIHQRNWGSIC